MHFTAESPCTVWHWNSDHLIMNSCSSIFDQNCVRIVFNRSQTMQRSTTELPLLQLASGCVVQLMKHPPNRLICSPSSTTSWFTKNVSIDGRLFDKHLLSSLFSLSFMEIAFFLIISYIQFSYSHCLVTVSGLLLILLILQILFMWIP